MKNYLFTLKNVVVIGLIFFVLSGCGSKSFSLTFNANGGTLPSEFERIMQIDKGDYINLPTPIKEGYDFVGWFTGNEETSSPLYNNSIIESDKAIYARWKATSYTVMFKDYNGLIFSTQTVIHDSDAIIPDNPKRVGYNFKGWDQDYTNVTSDLVITALYNIDTFEVVFKDYAGVTIKVETVEYGKDATASILEDRIGYNFIGWNQTFTNVTKDLVISPIYTEKTYQVTFKDYNGLIFSIQTVIHDSDAIIPDNPKRVGYTFKGWDQDYTNVTSNLVITALYEVYKYTITFDSNGGSNVLPICDVMYDTTIELTIPTKEGFDFVGWFLGNDVTSSPFYNNSKVQEDLTLYAKWQQKEHYVQFVDNNDYVIFAEYVKHGASAHAPVLSKEGYTFIGWDQEFSIILNDTIIRALYNPIDYVITFYSNGGSSVERITQAYQSLLPILPTPIKEGYNLFGWYLDEALSTPFTSPTMPLNGCTLYAKWEYATFNIFFDTLGGDLVDTISVKYNDTITSLPDATRIDYILEGWLLNDELLTTPFVYTYLDDITLVAKWKGLSEDIEFEVVDSKSNVLSYNGIEAELNLPDTIGGYPIVEIKANAFKDNSTLIKVTLGKYVTTLGDRAFSDMTSLTEIVLPSSTTNIGSCVFIGCINLEQMTFSSEVGYELQYFFGNDINNIPNALTKIKYANGSTSINKTLLQAYLNKVEEIELAGDTRSIPDKLFENMSNLKKVIIPDSVTTIGSYAFKNCTNLTSIIIPDSTYSIGSEAFYNCTSLTSVVIPNSVTNIGNYAFYFCESLTSLEIGNNVASIGMRAFYNCKSLISVEIGNSVTSIGISTFAYCTSLTSIIIPDSVASIGADAFNGCRSLTIYAKSKSKPNGWDTLWNNSNCQVLWGFVEIRENDQFKYAVSSHNTVTIIGLISPSSLTNVIIPEAIDDLTVVMIELSAFKDNTNIKSVHIPNSIVEIVREAFSGCTNLESVTFGVASQVLKIGDKAFYDCSSLTSIELPNSVTSMGIYAFSNCSSLNHIIIPDSVTSMGIYAFGNCSNLTSIVIPSSISSIENYVFRSCTKLSTIIISDGVTNIGLGAFFDCNSLTSIEIPNSVTSIGTNAFFNCKSLTSIIIPESVISIGSNAFPYCSQLTIYCEAISKPVGWDDSWNSSNCPIVWGYNA